MGSQDQTVRLLLSNLSDDDFCTVSFEPLGGQVAVGKGEALTVEISGPGNGIVEVSHVSNGLIIGEWEGATTRVMNHLGEVVEQG